MDEVCYGIIGKLNYSGRHHQVVQKGVSHENNKYCRITPASTLAIINKLMAMADNAAILIVVLMANPFPDHLTATATIV